MARLSWSRRPDVSTRDHSVAIAVAYPLSITAPTTTQSVKINDEPGREQRHSRHPSLPTTTNVTLTLTAPPAAWSACRGRGQRLDQAQVTSNGSTRVIITAPLAAIDATLADANGLTYAQQQLRR